MGFEDSLRRVDRAKASLADWKRLIPGMKFRFLTRNRRPADVVSSRPSPDREKTGFQRTSNTRLTDSCSASPVDGLLCLRSLLLAMLRVPHAAAEIIRRPICEVLVIRLLRCSQQLIGLVLQRIIP